MTTFSAIMALIPYFIKLMNLFIKTPNEKREELLNDLSNAFKKAEGSKDLSDLSRFINQ